MGGLGIVGWWGGEFDVVDGEAFGSGDKLKVGCGGVDVGIADFSGGVFCGEMGWGS